MISSPSISPKQLRLAAVGLALLVSAAAGWQAVQQGLAGRQLAAERAQLALSPADQDLARSLAPLPAHPLPSMAESLARLSGIQPEVGKLSWQESAAAGKPSPDSEKKDSPTDLSGADRLGLFQTIQLEFTGDLWEQMGFLKQLRSSAADYAIIQSLEGTPTSLKLSLRVYGQKGESRE